MNTSRSSIPQQVRPGADASTVGLPLEQGQDGAGSEQIPAHLIPMLARYRTLKQLQDYFDSKQYVGRPSFWTGLKAEGGEPVPLRERAPCQIYPLPKNAVRQTCRFMLGEGHWPALRIETTEGDEASPEDRADASLGADDDDDFGLSEPDAEALKAGLDELVEKSGLQTTFRRIVERGLATGTSVVVFAIRRGRFSMEFPHARDCWPTFENDDPSGKLVQMTWAYRYRKQVPENDQLVTKTYWFRRDFTDTVTVSYAPVEETTDGKAPMWGARKTEEHKLGFCPVRWFRNGDFDSSSIDGLSLYDGLLDEIDAVNLALSQRHRGIHYHGTPQGWETGVEPGDGPEANARLAGSYSADEGRQTMGRVAKKGRPKGPDKIWSYQAPDAKVGLLETTGTAFDTTSKHVEDVRGRTLESMSVVIFNAETILKMGSSEMSAKLLRLLYAPLLALVADLRTSTWGPALIECLSVMVRMVVALEGKGIRIRKAKKLARLGRQFLVTTKADDEGDETTEEWSFPEIELAWGPSFEIGPSEIAGGIDGALKAKEGGLIATKTAAGFVAPFFGVKDTVAELKLVERDQAKATKINIKATADQTKAVAAATPQPQPPETPPKGPQA